MKGLLVILLILGIAVSSLTGCTTLSDSTRTKTEATAVGAGGGAVIGGIIGAFLGDAGLGALFGTAAGAAIGYGYGSHVAKRKAEYAETEDWLDACIVSLDEKNKETMHYNTQLDQNIKDMDATITNLTNLYKNKEIEKAVLDEEKKKVVAKLAEVKKKLKQAKFELKNQQKVLDEMLAEAESQKHADMEIDNDNTVMDKMKSDVRFSEAREKLNKARSEFEEQQNALYKQYTDTLAVDIASFKEHVTELETHTQELASLSKRTTL